MVGAAIRFGAPAARAQKAERLVAPPIERQVAQQVVPQAARRQVTPWLAVLLLSAATGVAGFYAYEQYTMTTEENDVLRAQVADATLRAAVSDERMLALEADLSRSRGEFAAQSTIAATRAASADALAEKLRAALDRVGEVSENNQEISLQLVDKVLFRVGEAELTEKGEKVLQKLGALLKEIPDRQIWVQGHTDDTPLSDSNQAFATNWELSAARALTVVHYLEDVSEVDARRLAAVAFGQHRPVSKNNRGKNRRIEIVLYPPSLPVASSPVRTARAPATLDPPTIGARPSPPRTAATR